MRYALIKNGVVANTIIADSTFIKVIASDWDDIIEIPDDECGIGWSFDGKDFFAPVQPEEPVEPEPISTENLIPINPAK